jgi:MoaA/NifB/PqqE/SkfB family radical SAM enzyme
MPDGKQALKPRLDPRKFCDPDHTVDGARRAVVALTQLRTLWFNTGSLCNITCRNCFMDSSPTNDRLAYLDLEDVDAYLDEITRLGLPVSEIGFTGGEPFMNRALVPMLESVLGRGMKAMVLTNAMKPLLNKQAALLGVGERHGAALSVRVSMDHYSREKHEAIRGPGTWSPMLKGLKWLAEHGFNLAVAGRTLWHETDEEVRRGYASVFTEHGIPVDPRDAAQLVLFPEMDEAQDVPEITVSCWDILGVPPETMMCATARMVVKHRGASGPVVMPCTLLPYGREFELGEKLASSTRTVKLNHPHCARFCVLGGGSCSQ